MERMKPTAYKIGEGERKSLSKDMHEVIGTYQEENNRLEEENKELKEWAEENSYLRAKLRKIEGELEIAKKERDEYKERWERSFSV